MFDFFKKRADEGKAQIEAMKAAENDVIIDRDAFLDELLRGVDKTGVALDEDMQMQLMNYYELVVRTNANMNLTGITEAREFAEKHIIDSLMLSQFLTKYKNELMDVGTGAGFPALPLAITHPFHRFAVIESMNKRYEFIKYACKTVGINNIAISRYRAEEAGHRDIYRGQFHYATARAVAPLNVLTEYCMPFVEMGGAFLAMKGSNYKEELDGAKNAIFQLGGKLEEIREYELSTGEKRAIIVIRRNVPCRREYPRSGGKISKSPL